MSPPTVDSAHSANLAQAFHSAADPVFFDRELRSGIEAWLLLNNRVNKANA
jgi:hypothetical protein